MYLYIYCQLYKKMYVSCKSFWKENSHSIHNISCLEFISCCQDSSVTRKSPPSHCFMLLDGDHTATGNSLLFFLLLERPEKNYFFPDLHHMKFEIEDGTTVKGREIRFGYDPQEFPSFSWRGYAQMSSIQVS